MTDDAPSLARDAPGSTDAPDASDASDATGAPDPEERTEVTDPGHRPLPLVRIATVLSAIGVVIVVIALVTLTAHQRTEGRLSQDLHTVFWYFDVGREHNVATWYATGLWLLVAAVAVAIALSRPPRRRSWWVVATVATVASVDEALELHERLDGPAQRVAALLPFDLWFTWVLIGLPIALVVGAVLLRTILALPIASRIGILVAGTLFVLGAVGVETLNGRTLARADGVVTNTYLYATMVEEVVEMTAVSLALASLLALAQHSRATGTLRLDPRVSGRGGAPSAARRRPPSGTRTQPADRS
ncbi:hypothetical protein C8046_05730 [Serinibacter arcticus]|uniref:Uncharacterized protein n=1 Tax=Serinibacter arcticus TaxID=1655435 RepID=A0A2U1ZTC9_9MICO|nr:hypothetical protein [Serinibacter arcticus]PWD50238.1 hypothetical protein C8046_05730 [Serinibacter arcticus]